MKLVFLPGEVDEERVKILQAADGYDDLRTSMELHTIPPAAYYLAQCRELHDRQVSGPTITAGWSSFVAGESEINSSAQDLWNGVTDYVTIAIPMKESSCIAPVLAAILSTRRGALRHT